MSNVPSSRLIDPRGHRFGAGVSVVLLALAFLFNLPLIVGIVGIALAVSAWFGTRYSALGRPWPYVRRALRVGPPAELESEIPPRFAQALGTLGLGLAIVFFIAGFSPVAWLLTGAVGALQFVLAATGYCLGCRLYFLRWYVPGLFARLAR
jgi:TM2 domain-containing membrane protein YozV